MSPNFLLFLQSMLISLQIVNAGLASVTHNAALTLAVGALVGGMQFFIQNVGNKTVPPPEPKAK
jgi:hypothetical protein